jgi:predicted transcriptional regulator
MKRPVQIALNVAGVLCFFLSVGFILAINWIKAQQILDGRKKFDVELTRVAPYPEIRTADDILYVGSTKNYIFFKTPDGSMVVPRAQVIELKQKKVRYGL